MILKRINKYITEFYHNLLPESNKLIKNKFKIYKNEYGYENNQFIFAKNETKITGYQNKTFKFILNKHEFPLVDRFDRRIPLHNIILIKNIYLPTSKLGQNTLLKKTVNNEEFVRVNNTFVPMKIYAEYNQYKQKKEEFKNTKKKYMRIIKNEEYLQLQQLKKKYKYIEKVINKERKIKSRKFLSMGDTPVLLRIVINDLVYYVSLVEPSVLQNYYNRNHLNKRDKIINILEKQYTVNQQNVMNNRIINLQQFVEYVYNKKSRIILISPNKYVLDLIYELALDNIRISILRKQRNNFYSQEILMNMYDKEIGIVTRYENSLNYQHQFILQQYGTVDIEDLFKKMFKIITVNDFKYIQILIQNIIQPNNLLMYITKNSKAIEQINSVLQKYRKITVQQSIHKMNEQSKEISDIYTEILKTEKYYVDMQLMILLLRQAPLDFYARHERAKHLKQQLINRRLVTEKEYNEIMLGITKISIEKIEKINKLLP